MAKEIAKKCKARAPAPQVGASAATQGLARPKPSRIAATLRSAAEARLAVARPARPVRPAQPARPAARSAEALLHELQVHQIELEMQNEALQQGQILLQESRDRYIDLYEFAPVGYLTLSHRGDITEANLTAATLFDLERNRLLKRRFDLLVAAEQRSHWQRQSAEVLAQQGTQTLELMLKRGDGTLFCAELRCRRLDEGAAPSGLRVALTDITRRKEVERALAERDAEYRAVVETAGDGIWMLDQDGRILAVNDAYVRRSGYSREELLSMRIADLEAQESLADIRRHIEKVHRNGSDLFETRHRTKDGEVWPAEIHASYWPTPEGGRLFGVLRDLTERKRSEAKFQELRAEMEDVMRFHVVSQTVAAVAHELNQPLNAVASYSEAALRLWRSGNPKPDRLLHALERNVQQAQRAGRVLHELMELMNRGEVATERVDLNEVLRMALARIEAETIIPFRTRLELAPGLAPVSANAVQVEKVLLNLIQNGVEAMHGAGIQSKEILVAVTTAADGCSATVTVRDCGPGIDAETLHRLFDPFFTTKTNGLGMGLAISRAIIEAHGGQLWAESAPGEGACFHFTLPVAA